MKYIILNILLISLALTSFAQENKKEESNSSEPEYIDVLFKNFILLELGNLPDEENQKTNEQKPYEVYERTEEDWTATVAAVLNFSETIEVAIWDGWIKSSEYAKAIGIDFTISQFADQFIEKYNSKDNNIDVWEENQLEEAKKNIERYKKEQSTKK